jgi:hypothetical protein
VTAMGHPTFELSQHLDWEENEEQIQTLLVLSPKLVAA